MDVELLIEYFYGSYFQFSLNKHGKNLNIFVIFFTDGRSEEVLQRGSRSAAVHFPDDKHTPDDTTSAGLWRFDQANQLESQQSLRTSKSQKSGKALNESHLILSANGMK